MLEVKTRRFLAMSLSAASLFSFSAQANEEPKSWNINDLNLTWDWQASIENTQTRTTVFSNNKEQQSTAINGLLDLEASYGSWLGLFAIKGFDLYANYSHQPNATHQNTIHPNTTQSKTQVKNKAKADFVIRELFWQGGVDVSSELVGDQYLDITLGKVRLDWGIGYGYRPLDVIKPYQRNPIGIVAEEGAGVASVSSFDSNGEWTLIYSDSSWTSQDVNAIEKQSQQQGIGVRRYGLVDEHEYQWLGYYDDVRHGLLGASVVSVLDLAWEFHGSAVYQRHSLGYELPSQRYAPVTLKEQGDAAQVLAGFTWANEVGNSFILEYWFDSRAWSHSQWQTAIKKGQALTNVPATTRLGASYAQGYQHANLVQHNLMFHWSLDSTAWSQWRWSESMDWLSNLTPTFDVLYSPEDGGVIATQWLHYGLMDTGDALVDLELAARFLSGKNDSAYANLPNSHMILLNIKGRF